MPFIVISINKPSTSILQSKKKQLQLYNLQIKRNYKMNWQRGLFPATVNESGSVSYSDTGLSQDADHNSQSDLEFGIVPATRGDVVLANHQRLENCYLAKPPICNTSYI